MSTENYFLTTYHSSFMVHWWVLVYCGLFEAQGIGVGYIGFVIHGGAVNALSGVLL
jgi:hypothetical protein